MNNKFDKLTKEDIEYIRSAYESGVPNHIIAAKFGITDVILGKWINNLGGSLKRPPKKITSSISDKICELWDAGYTKKRIADELKISKWAVVHYLVAEYGDCVVTEYKCHSKRKLHRVFTPNENAPTPDTVMLIRNYYREDIAKGLPHADAVDDIHFELGRDYDYIHRVLENEGLI